MLEQPFLQQVAKLYKDELSTDSRSLCFVFPNRRAAVFFRKYVSELVSKPIFSPELLTMNELFGKMSGLQQLDRITLLQKLHSCYTDVCGVEEPFDEFVYWGDMLLADFNDVDKYLVDAGQLFMNIADLKSIQDDFSYLTDEQREALVSFWSNYFRGGEGEVKKGFKSSWDRLLPLYEAFNRLLESEGCGYEGMIYRRVVAGLESGNVLPEFEKVVFAGLNALNECEKKLLDVLRDAGKADFYWDFDSPMLKDRTNRASFFVAPNIKRYPSQRELPVREWKKPSVTVFSVPSAVGQAKYVEKILAGLVVDSNTALVLPDASLLNAAVSSIPEGISSVNITMGYPLQVSELASFMDSLAELHLRCRYDAQGNVRFYHKPVLELLRHSYIGQRKVAKELINDIFKSNMIFVPGEKFGEDDFLKVMFAPVIRDPESDDCEQIAGLVAYQLRLLFELGTMLPGVEKEFVKSYHSVLMRVADMKLGVRPKTYFKLVSSLVSGINVPYRGEPLSGLQIMGPLETRALDFENLIIASVNEGIFPSQNVASSFIPYTLRRGFGLPTYEYQDAIWAYYFYRLLSRAENVYLLCDSRVEGVRGGGESRYIKQLEFLYRDLVDFKKVSVAYNLNVDTGSDVVEEIGKTDEVMEKIRRVFLVDRRPFSASAVNEYLECPLKFYYSRVEQRQQDEEIEESAGYATFGTIYHKVMEDIYKPFVGRTVSREDLEGIGDIEGTTRKAMLEITRAERLKGQNIINMRVISRMVEKTVEIDMGKCPFEILGLERSLEKELPVKIEGKDERVKMFGFADRIDRKDGVVTVIDYKTGGISVDGSIADAFDRESAKRPYTLLQMCFYQWLVEGKTVYAGIKCGKIYTLKSIFRELPDELMFTKEDIDCFLSNMIGIVEEIFSRDVPFAKGANARCEYCDFRSNCLK